MICPVCKSKVKFGTQLSIAVHGVFMCKQCSTKIEIKTTAARIFDWLIELILLPLGLLLVFIADLSYFFMATYLISLFVAWFLVARISIKKRLHQQ